MAYGSHVQRLARPSLGRGLTGPRAGGERAGASAGPEDGLRDPLDAVQRMAEEGVRGPGSSLPYAGRLQAAFGAHDLGGVRAHIGAGASASCEGMEAEAYATGPDLAFDGTPSLFVAAHEATHVVQQQQGVQLKGGVGEAGDAYERQANEVAARVVRGESAEPILDQIAPGGGAATGAGAEASVQAFSLNPFKAIKKAWNKHKQKKNQKKMDQRGEEMRDDRDRWLTEERSDWNIEDVYEEGDLFYGLSHPREKMMSKVTPNLDEHLHSYDDNGVVAPTKTPLIVDTLNNMFLGTGVEMNNPALKSEQFKDKEFKKQANTYKGEQENEIAPVKGFREFLEGHDRYNPRMAPGQEEWGTRVGRACKGGLEYTTKELQKKIHFVLDDYDFQYLWDDIGRVGEQRAITSKELKWLFRSWDDPSISANVVFWRGGKVVLPPWVENPEPWKNYKLYRKNKGD